MSLTFEEQKRINNIEETVQDLSNLIKNVSSNDMLNRLLVLGNEEIRRLTERVDSLEDKVITLTTLARKLQ